MTGKYRWSRLVRYIRGLVYCKTLLCTDTKIEKKGFHLSDLFVGCVV